MKNLNDPMKYLVVCGCSMSGLGKGTIISSLGQLLIKQNYIVTAIKVDPYLNIDAGTMSPSEHGEVFVLSDGGEVDLDLGNYERALNAQFTKDHNITSGKVFHSILTDERKGNYLGKTIQMVPHVTERIQKMIENTAENYKDKNGRKAHICLVEIGGTVGDLESAIFFEAIRQFANSKGSENCAIMMISHVPILGQVKEAKTKPTQHGIRELKSLGIFPDFIVCRSDIKIEMGTYEKISFFSNISIDRICNCYNVNVLSEIPIIMNEQGVDRAVLRHFKFGYPNLEINSLKLLPQAFFKINDSKADLIKILVCGKYCNNNDTYYSLIKAINDSALLAKRKISISLIDVSILDSNDSNEETEQILRNVESADGIVIPGGFGIRGSEGKIKICRIAREKNIPFLGICLGLQISVIEFCRNVLKIKDATSLEFDENTKSNVITTMIDVDYENLGGTQRLGAKPAYITDKNCLSFRIYGEEVISERHRHRYEVNNDYVEKLEQAGMKFTGKNKEGDRMDMVELSQDTHPFFYGLQSHPEFNGNPFLPSLPFYAFLMHASKQNKEFQNYVSSKLAFKGKKSEFDESYFLNQLSDIINEN